MKLFASIFLVIGSLIAAPAMATDLQMEGDPYEQWYLGGGGYNPQLMCVTHAVYSIEGVYLGCLHECSEGPIFYPYSEVSEGQCLATPPRPPRYHRDFLKRIPRRGTPILEFNMLE